MKYIFTLHSLQKFAVLRRLGWDLSKSKVRQTVKTPRWRGKTKFGQETAMSLLDKDHILRVILNREESIINIITFHPARRGTYESALR